MKWMVTIRFNPRDAQQQAEMAALLPQEQAHSQMLREQHILDAIYISADRRFAWLIMDGDSQERVQQIVAAYPFYPYMELEIAQLVS